MTNRTRPIPPRAPSPFASLTRLAPLAGLLFAALALAGCHSNPGEACSDTPGSCSDKASHLVCTGGKYVLETCKGQGGCADDKSLTCDNTKADVGDGCGHDGARACSVDGTKELRCRGGQFGIEWSCRGGCTLDESNNPKCIPTGLVGDACRPDSIVCDVAAEDGARLRRRQARCDADLPWCPRVRHCRRAAECAAIEPRRSRAKSAAPRARARATWRRRASWSARAGTSRPSSSASGRSAASCPGNYSVRCDKSIVNENEPCTEESSLSCTSDGKQVKCTDGKFVIDKKWKPKKGETCANRYRVSFETEKFEAR